jgi:toxin-antitoxin system PIN domain toxin
LIAVDTNILVYAHRRDAGWHGPARACVKSLAEGRAAWAIPWPCIHEFIAVVTHPRIYRPPSTPAEALAQVDAWLDSPSVVLLAETEGYLEVLRDLVAASKVAGPQVHDARIAALCRLHGVRELWSADRDFSRYPAVTLVNPLVA